MFMRNNKQKFEYAIHSLTDYEREEIEAGKSKVMTGLYLESLEYKEKMITLFDGIVEGIEGYDDKYLFALIRDALAGDTEAFNSEIGATIIDRIVAHLSSKIREEAEAANA